jgi:hypothetical protein
MECSKVTCNDPSFPNDFKLQIELIPFFVTLNSTLQTHYYTLFFVCQSNIKKKVMNIYLLTKLQTPCNFIFVTLQYNY